MQVIWELDYGDCYCISALFILYSVLKALVYIERRQGTAVVHSCQNHEDKQWLTSSAVDSIPAFFFSFWIF